ncbi:hypothetical protein [Thiobacillus denitrificans]|uniref:hypothetical protein n=1 Tax=Thiobacillus denitrificans TaxID=36861 RepID=UPI0003705880|nr:hypothetical protein [Thiobacillus denitrificans]
MAEESLTVRTQLAAEAAEAAFWATIGEHFPEAKAGDFPPGAQLAFGTASTVAVSAWVAFNVIDPATKSE